jgi:arylsulfatase A-like enzyme
MTKQSVSWIRFQQAMTPDRPFFVYFAPGATHAPHHAPRAFIERYRGQFDGGWDRLREATPRRQIELGVVPQNAGRQSLPPRLSESSYS